MRRLQEFFELPEISIQATKHNTPEKIDTPDLILSLNAVCFKFDIFKECKDTTSTTNSSLKKNQTDMAPGSKLEAANTMSVKIPSCLSDVSFSVRSRELVVIAGPVGKKSYV